MRKRVVTCLDTDTNGVEYRYPLTLVEEVDEDDLE